MLPLFEAVDELADELRNGWSRLIAMTVLRWCTQHKSAHHGERAGATFDEHQKTSKGFGKLERLSGC